MIVTGESHAVGTRQTVPGVEIITEPVGRNTAAAIGLAAAILAARDPDAVLLVLPADQHVTDKAAFEKAVEAAKTGCPISKLLNATITMNAALL